MLLQLTALILSGNCLSSKERKECNMKGFDSSVLECSTCNIVKKYTRDDELVSLCKKCCNKFTIEKYAQAIFEYDEKYITSELMSFVEGEADRIPNLEVKKRPGAYAELSLMNSQGQAMDRFSCLEWSTKEVVQFLNEKLRKY
ncbi:hypothetical protein BLNAU_2344 [Blattamonas nauphoetae]|uniref:Selenoprotein F n=1 Tax=Blattamonas nauphoetae TaxID=2049346 RepID=A0ABQ9YFH3_9EUKA|nr:hypothetical protein BLNAU_2344 [Blattamonas nauphoetae]